MRKMNPEWSDVNDVKLKELEEEQDPALLKELLLDVFDKLLENNEDKTTNRQKFRLNFATELLGGAEARFMDDKSFDFFVEQVGGGGEKLDNLW